jgi:Dual specificity phosphatase, catalytic domain
MQQINDWLYIGKWVDTRDFVQLRRNEIGAMLLLAADMRQPDIESLYLPVSDGEALPLNYIERGMRFVAQEKNAHKKIMIACGAGISRSATFCMAALKEQEGLSLVEAYRLIFQHHPIACPHPELIKSLAQYYPDEPDYETLRQAIYKVEQESG